MGSNLVKPFPELRHKGTWLSPASGFRKCSSCRACKFGTNKTHYTTPFSNMQVPIKGSFTCKAEFAVYVLTCTCGLHYIGSTKFQVHVRILQHLRAILHTDHSYPVARHFKTAHNSNINCLSYYVISAIPKSRRGGNRERALRQLETRMILEFNCKMPNGLNNTEDMHNFL